MASRIFIERDTLTPGLKKIPPKLDLRIGAVMEFNSVDAQNKMRTGATWIDRTGNARQGLFARAGKTESSYFIVLYHTVPYGIYLETRWVGKYAVIAPTMRSVGVQVLKDLRKLLK